MYNVVCCDLKMAVILECFDDMHDTYLVTWELLLVLKYAFTPVAHSQHLDM